MIAFVTTLYLISIYLFTYSNDGAYFRSNYYSLILDKTCVSYQNLLLASA